MYFLKGCIIHTYNFTLLDIWFICWFIPFTLKCKIGSCKCLTYCTPIHIFMKIELGHANVSKAKKMSCLDKCSNLCVIFLINLFICKWLGLAPRCKHWGPECWIKVCYLLCGLLISFVSVVPDCVTAEYCDCLSLSAASALTPRHFFFIHF